MEDNLSRSDVAFARNRFTEGAQNGQRIRMRSPVGAPDNWGVRNVLAKKRVQVGPIVQKFGLDPRLSAVSSSLRRMRGADETENRCRVTWEYTPGDSSTTRSPQALTTVSARGLGGRARKRASRPPKTLSPPP